MLGVKLPALTPASDAVVAVYMLRLGGLFFSPLIRYNGVHVIVTIVADISPFFCNDITATLGTFGESRQESYPRGAQ